MGRLSLLQGIFLTQGLNPGLPHCRWILYHSDLENSMDCITEGLQRVWHDWVTFTFIERLFSSSSLSAIMVVSSAYLRLLLFLLAILIPACVSLYISLYIYRYDILLCFNPNLIIYISSCPSFPFGECTSFPGSSDGKESTCSVGDLGSIPGLERCPGGGHGNPLQYSCLENP